jgi:phage terminase large subunit GpA-like protein
LGRNVTSRPGKYSLALSPFQREPQESFTSPLVQTTVLYWAKRLGKTEMINNLHGSVIHQNPRNILVVYPTIDSSKKWSRQFFDPMVDSTPVLKNRVKNKKVNKEKSNTVLSKEFPGGVIAAIGANSASGFRQVQAPVVTCDEIDAMEDDMTEDGKGEGDPVIRAFGRAENYSDSVQVVSSTATRLRFPEESEMAKEKGTGSRIHDWWLDSDQRKWFIKSPCCGKFHVLAWKNVKWPEGHKHEEAWYECPDCGVHWNDETRIKAILAGEWRSTADFHGIRGYWLNGLNTTFPPKKGYKTKLHQMAAEFQEANKKGKAAQIAWQNTFLCEPYLEEAERISTDPLYERQEGYNPQELPNEVVIVFLVVDVQGDRLEYEFIGLGEGEETWGIEYGRIEGNPEKQEVWNDLKNQTMRQFNRRDGVALKVSCIGVDHRHKGDKVRQFLKTCGHPKAFAVYGAAGDAKQGILVVPKLNKKYRIRLHSVGTEVAKDMLFARLKIKEAGTRYMHYPKGHGYDRRRDGYFDQLTAEEVRFKYHKGRMEKYYEKVRDRNEALDLRVYFLALVDILNPVVSIISHQLLEQIKSRKGFSAPEKSEISKESLSGNLTPIAKKKRFSFHSRSF